MSMAKQSSRNQLLYKYRYQFGVAWVVVALIIIFTASVSSMRVFDDVNAAGLVLVVVMFVAGGISLIPALLKSMRRRYHVRANRK